MTKHKSSPAPKPVGGAVSVPMFLAHSLFLETEAMNRYADLAKILDAHNNPEVAKLFEDMHRYAAIHVQEVNQLSKTAGGLPELAPWEYVWFDDESPESAPFEDAHYLMSPAQALKIALACELRARDYYAGVAAATQDNEVKKLAEAFAAEEGGHASLVQVWIDRLSPTAAGWSEDPDEPRSSD